jgi:serine/threonine protein phosphatase PrpC
MNSIVNPDNQSVFQFAEKTTRLTLQVGWETDKGGCSYNQDRKAYIPIEDGCLIAVADGHGINGEDSAEIAVKSLEKYVQDKMSDLLKDQVAFLDNACEYIHGEIIKGITNPRCGTTFSVILLLGKKIWIANVGDSTGILCAKHNIFKPSHLKFEKDTAVSEKVVISSDEGVKLSDYIVLTDEGHSPENIEEYKRMRKFMCSEDNPNHAELLCVYDIQYETKKFCPPIFNISEDGEPTLRPDDGSFNYYHKNVRKDKGTYVCVRDGENALSSTRSFGDIALNKLGVSNKPVISSMDLEIIFKDLNTAREEADRNRKEEFKRHLDAITTSLNGVASNGVTPNEVEPDPMSVCVVLCSDGVWDNWQYGHVQKFVMDKSCLKAVENDKRDGCQRVCKSFMLRNQTFATRNFGRNSDNATGIVMYITEEEE